jgi:hypothetical protein
VRDKSCNNDVWYVLCFRVFFTQSCCLDKKVKLFHYAENIFLSNLMHTITGQEYNRNGVERILIDGEIKCMVKLDLNRRTVRDLSSVDTTHKCFDWNINELGNWRCCLSGI